MDTGKTYFDSEGNECNILQAVKREPEWAANRVQEGEKAIEQVKELESEIERLSEMLADKAVSETLITDLSINNGLHIGLEGGAARILAESFADQFIESGAENYLEMRFSSTKNPDLILVVTLQKVTGKTPHQFRVEAEQRVKELEQLAHHCKMFILKNQGYHQDRNDELALFEDEFKKLEIE